MVRTAFTAERPGSIPNLCRTAKKRERKASRRCPWPHCTRSAGWDCPGPGRGVPTTCDQGVGPKQMELAAAWRPIEAGESEKENSTFGVKDFSGVPRI